MNNGVQCYEQLSTKLWTMEYNVMNNGVQCYEQWSAVLWTMEYNVMNNGVQFYGQWSTVLWTMEYKVMNNGVQCYGQWSAMLWTMEYSVMNNGVQCYEQWSAMLWRCFVLYWSGCSNFAASVTIVPFVGLTRTVYTQRIWYMVYSQPYAIMPYPIKNRGQKMEGNSARSRIDWLWLYCPLPISTAALFLWVRQVAGNALRQTKFEGGVGPPYQAAGVVK